MATEAIQPSFFHRVSAFVRDSFHEIRQRTTWPDFPQVRQASLAIMVFVLIVGLFITLLDVVMRVLLQDAIPALFR